MEPQHIYQSSKEWRKELYRQEEFKPQRILDQLIKEVFDKRNSRK